MNWVVVVLLLIAAAAVAAAIVRYAQGKKARQKSAQERATPKDPFAQSHGNEDLLFALKVGDVVHYHAADYLVRGSLRFDERGYTWAEHLISDGRDQHWLSVEDDEGIAVVLWQRVKPDEVEGEPGAKSVIHQQVAYRLKERGSATFTAQGTTGTAPSGTAEYVDYEGPDGAQLSFERFGERWEVSTGRALLPRVLDVFPVSSDR